MPHIQKYRFLQFQGQLFWSTCSQHLCKLIDSPVNTKQVRSQEAEQSRDSPGLCYHYVLRALQEPLGAGAERSIPYPKARDLGAGASSQGRARGSTQWGKSQLLLRGTVTVRAAPCKRPRAPANGSACAGQPGQGGVRASHRGRQGGARSTAEEQEDAGGVCCPRSSCDTATGGRW